MAFMEDDDNAGSFPDSIPLHVNSIDSRSVPHSAQSGKKKTGKGSKKKSVDCPIFLQSKLFGNLRLLLSLILFGDLLLWLQVRMCE